MCTPAGGYGELTAESDEELFYATLGGMGLTGVVTEATLAVEELGSPWLAVDVDRTDGLEGTLALMSEPEDRRYSVAWLDLLARGAKLGRGIVSRADHLPGGHAPRGGRGTAATRGGYADALLHTRALEVPRRFPAALVREAGVRAFNALRWHTGPRRERSRRRALAPYLFPLDRLGEWHRLYGAGGLLQYQFVVPRGEEDAITRSVELMRARRLPVYLAVFKRLGPAFGGPLSFPLAGWTLAVDVPAGAPGARVTLDELDELLASCGGRVYLTKDARLRRDALEAMYPQLERFRAQRRRVDPDGVLGSDLSRRLRIEEAGG
jgi:decaprenylphospho-beta-D-ribofuranose 2-oxidase